MGIDIAVGQLGVRLLQLQLAALLRRHGQHNKASFIQGCGSGLDPDSIGSVDPDPDPIGQK
jgi:hypothetical protein